MENSSETKAPRAFICHATEDKEKYAIPLTAELLSCGVRAWIDEWEITFGDDLVQKIYNEGLDGDTAVIILITDASVEKPWVKDEMSFAKVKQIEGEGKVIPVPVHGCQVPNQFIHIRWAVWGENDTASDVAKRIADQLFNVEIKPPLGLPPGYIGKSRLKLQGLQEADLTALEAVFRAVINGGNLFTQIAECLPFSEELGLSQEEFLSAIEYLSEEGIFQDVQGSLRHPVIVFRVPPRLFFALSEANGYEVDELLKSVASLIINEGVVIKEELEGRLPNYPPALVEAAVKHFEEEGYLRVASALGGHYSVYNMSAKFKRWFTANS